ncbi:hypothetical protein XF_2350 [Xylella fastidiosa 9a5c]|uniref:Uncharacterized protein n=1 Tax=Xylella fastidiosa (strain 9a5c) TaxID=160492 RepID=Q9PAZ5_XYLFA|nr:hypothetical protein XF_2350 [Xylella fastidiosa 9a5c]
MLCLLFGDAGHRPCEQGGLGYVEWCLPVCDVSNCAMTCPVCSLWPMGVCYGEMKKI